MTPRNRFESLGNRLLHAGLSPRYVRRSMRELDDHLSDLIAEFRCEGLSRAEAERRARQRLGTEDDLVAELLASAPRRTFTARFPAIVYSLGVFGGAAGAFAGTGLLIGLAGVADVGSPALKTALIYGHYLFGSYLLTPAAAAWACRLAHTHRSRLRWALLAAAVLAVAGGLFLQFTITMPEGTPASGTYSVGFHMANGLAVKSLWRLLSPIAVFALFAGWIAVRKNAGFEEMAL